MLGRFEGTPEAVPNHPRLRVAGRRRETEFAYNVLAEMNRPANERLLWILDACGAPSLKWLFRSFVGAFSIRFGWLLSS